MATLTIQKMTIDGIIDPTFAACSAGGDKFVNDGNTFLQIKAGATGTTVTLTSEYPNAPEGTVATNKDLVLAANEEGYIGPIDTQGYNSEDTCSITYSDTTTCTIAAITLGE